MAISGDIAFITETEEETRGARIWNRMLKYRKEGKLSLARAKLVTESYKNRGPTRSHPPGEGL
jgi:hypothetical protein